jgi:hypothetical protein
MHGLKDQELRDQGWFSSKKVLTTTKENMSMAPNSNFDFAVGDGNATAEGGQVHVTFNGDGG